MKKVDVLGVKIDDVSLNQALEQIQKWLEGRDKHYIVTPNPEFVMAARKDIEFQNILNKADLAIPDGVGLKLSGKIKNTTPGIDLMEKMVELAEDLGYTVGFLGGKDGVAEKCTECLKKKCPGLKVVFVDDGPEVNSEGDVIARNPAFGGMTKQFFTGDRRASLAMTERVDILFVAFGQVKQEKWIAKNLPYLSIKIAMGVGGSFDYLSGKVKRAPKWMRNFGLEWLFRLAVQPWRLKRQVALIEFVWLSLIAKLTSMRY